MISMQNLDQIYSESKKRIDSSQNILVTSHIRPDGDAVGSLLGLGLALLGSGKKVQMVLSDGVPASYSYLPGRQFIQKEFKQKYDLAIVVDSSDIGRTGKALDPLMPIDINIDHHLTNEKFADVNLVIVEAASTSEILAKFIPAVGLEISIDVAQNLLAGIVTDSIGFRTPNVRPETLRIAADLIDKGADLAFLYMKSLNSRTYSAIRFWGYGLSNLERQGDLVWTTLTMADRKSSGYSGRDDADLINILSTVEDAKINLIFVEQPNGHVKVSWRSVPGYDVSQVAILFGGGGHAAAAGADVDGNLEDVRLEVINKTYRLLLSNN
jgi:phosphoesterase RecJ-like protein